jgi:FKBP-type peptidyl-prolyl cis-trans isomerase SlyD
MKVAKGNIVRLEYELRVKGGDVVESSVQSGPIQYVHGEGKLLPALEKRLDGMEIGAERTGTIPAAEAFPEHSLPAKDIPRAEFPAGEKVDVGRVFQAKGPTGQPVMFKVSAVTDDKVTVRFLPPMFGKDLDFRVKVLMIDDPKSQKREAVAPPPVPADALAEPEK